MAKNTKLELYLEDSYQDRYLVEVKNKDGEWEVLPEFPFPMSKGLTVAVYFDAWCRMSEQNQYRPSIIREVFPSSLNSCYSQREKGCSILWTLCSGPDDEEYNTKNTEGKIRRSYLKAEDGYMIKLSDAGDDFYVVRSDDRYDFPTGKGGSYGEAYFIVKNWRDDDFDRFVDRMNNPYQVVWGNETLTLSEENIRIVKYRK